MPHTTPEPRHVSHLERKNFFVNSEEEGHCLGPRCQPSHITTNFLGIFHGVVFHLQVGHQQLDRFLVNGILSEEMVIQLENATETRSTLGKTSFYNQKRLECPPCQNMGESLFCNTCLSIYVKIQFLSEPPKYQF